MSKLAKKFLFSTAAVLAAVIVVSLFLNSNFIERYYLYREKQDMNRICNVLVEHLRTGGDVDARLRELEAQEDVVIARVKSSSDNEVLNERLRSAFLEKGIGLKKYWLWDQDQEMILNGERRIKLYQQKKLHYSILVEYVHDADEFIAAAKIIPSVARTISLINRMTAAIFLAALLLMVAILYFLVKRITTPLKSIGDTARAIAEQNFCQVHIHTGDELEDLAKDINVMSEKLKGAQAELQRKNAQMESLLANVSHDLKTPIALIKAYTDGMKDGLDDGTFLDTIAAQNERMEQMVKSLLALSRAEKEAYAPKPVNVSELIHNEIKLWTMERAACGVRFTAEIEDDVILMAGRQELNSIVSNLISNAVHYTADRSVFVSLCKGKEKGRYQLKVSNKAHDAASIDIERLWEPFYVREQSRNRELTGTGLGLSIVRASVKRCGYECACRMENQNICFEVNLS